MKPRDRAATQRLLRQLARDLHRNNGLVSRTRARTPVGRARQGQRL
jgi:hypothetical protein